MKTYLLPKEGQFYKANLHCHTTFSDGRLTPEEIKEEYKSKGYSVVAYTDHDILIPHPELADETFLPLNGYEIEVNEEREGAFADIKTCHICMIALEQDNLKQVCWHREKYLSANAVKHRDQVQFYEEEPDYERKYSPQCISDIMRRGREHGFFVTYNHPAWSGENYEQYSRYENMNAMEICNYGCYSAGYEDYTPGIYDDMLRAGKRIFCIGSDDNHNASAHDDPRWDSGGAWIVIKADKLEYRTITKALEEGNFYASQGPEIYELWIEDDKLCVVCSDADKIVLSTANRRIMCVLAGEGEVLNRAEFDLKESDILTKGGYIRITVRDFNGKHANTNAYFLDELRGR